MEWERSGPEVLHGVMMVVHDDGGVRRWRQLPVVSDGDEKRKKEEKKKGFWWFLERKRGEEEKWLI